MGIYGTRDGKFIVKDLTVKSDLSIEGDMSFGDASTDTLTVTGVASFSAATYHGTFGTPTTFVTDVPLIMISGNAAADLASGVSRCAWFRAKVSAAQTGNSIVGVEAQCRINDPTTLGAGQFTGIWAYWEMSGTAALNTGNLSSAISCTVEAPTTLTIDSGAILAGVVIDSSVHGSATATGTFDAIYIKKAGSALDFKYGIEFTDCVSGAMFKFADDAAIAGDSAASPLVDIKDTSSTGFIKVEVGSSTRYIALYDAKTS